MKQKNGYKVIKNRISQKSSKYLFDTLLNLLKFYSPDLFTNKKFNNWNNQDFNNRLIHLRKKNKNIFSAIYDSLSKSNALVQFCYMNRLDKIASNFLSVPKNCLSVRTFTLRMDVPNDKRNLYGWHQDSSYDKYNISGTNGAVLWIPLVSTNAKNGSLIIKLGSEVNDINASFEKKSGGKFTSKQILIKNYILKKYKTKQLKLNANSVLVNYSGLFHKSGINTSKKVRFVYIVRFNKIISKDFIHYRELN